MTDPSPIRVLVDYRPALRDRTGVGEYVHELLKGLLRLGRPGLRLTVFSSSWRDRVDARAKVELAGASFVDRRVPVRILNALWHRLEWPSVERLTGRTYDITHSLHPLLLPSRTAAAIVTVHDLHFLDHAEHASGEIRRDYPRLVAQHAARADRVIVPSRYTAIQVENRLGVAADRITVCSPGAPSWGNSEARLCRSDGYILFFGTLEPRKNVGVLLDAYARLANQHTEVPDLVLAGRTSEHAASWLERLAVPPLAGKARHLGYIEASERPALFEGARALVLPSLDEGFGLAALEAMALGVPVIAARRGALPELVGDAGLLVEPEPEALEDAMRQLLSDRSLASSLIERGRTRSLDYSWDRSARILADAYAETVHRRRAEPARPRR